jgi:cyclomaltodextrinase
MLKFRSLFRISIALLTGVPNFLLQAQTPDSTKDSTYPAWVKDAIFYQIFPERFRNDDPGNDPTIADLQGAWPHDPVKEWSISPWTSDWYKLQPWEVKNGKGFYYNAQLRRYGGDLQGIIKKLDYLVDLGITAIYLNPLFESPSLHKYDATCYHHIDDNFGPDPQADRRIITAENPADPASWQWTSADKLFLELLKQAHQRGLKVIIDGVFNHVGTTFWAFRDVHKNGQKSPFKDWFIVKKWDDPATPQDEFDYAGWMGTKELPEFREDENGIVHGPREHIFAIVKRWMDPDGDGNPADGIDGWRLDVAEQVSSKFWKEFRKVVKGINPQAYITAELFWDDWKNNKLMDPTPWLQGDQFDGVMNYRWASLCSQYFIDKQKKISATQFIDKLKDLESTIPAPTNHVLLNLMDSHDTDRLASHIVNPDLFYDKMISVPDNPQYNVRKPHADEIQIQKLIALFQFTFSGTPMIYYGTEAGMWGADDPDDRKPMVWPEYTYENESSHPFNQPRPSDTVYFDQDLFSYYQKLILIRRQHEVLRRGNWNLYLADDKLDLLVLERNFNSQTYFIIINNSLQSRPVSIDLESDTGLKNYRELLTDQTVIIKKSRLSLMLEKKSGAILQPITE